MNIYIPHKRLLVVKENGKIVKAFGGQLAKTEHQKRVIYTNTLFDYEKR